MHRQRLAQPRRVQLHTSPEGSRDHAHEGDPVAMLRVHVGLDLEDEAGDLVARGIDHLLARWLWPWGRGPVGDSRDQFLHPEILERRTEEHRGQIAVAKRLEIEFRIDRKSTRLNSSN